MGEPRSARGRRSGRGPAAAGQRDRAPGALAQQAPVAAMTPVQILAAADALAGPGWSGRAHGWPRVVAVLARHAIEEALRQYWALREPGMEHCTWHAQLLCLTAYPEQPRTRA